MFFLGSFSPQVLSKVAFTIYFSKNKLYISRFEVHSISNMFESMYKQFGQAVFEEDGIFGSSSELQQILSKRPDNQYNQEKHLLKLNGPARGSDDSGNYVVECLINIMKNKDGGASAFGEGDVRNQQRLRDQVVKWAEKNDLKALKLYKSNHRLSTDDDSVDSSDLDDDEFEERAKQHYKEFLEHLKSKTGEAGEEWGDFEFNLMSAAFNVTFVVITFEKDAIKAKSMNVSGYEGTNKETFVYFGHHPKKKILDFTSNKDEYTCLSVEETPTKADLNAAFDYDSYIQAFQLDEEMEEKKIPLNVGMAVLKAFRNNSSDLAKHTNKMLAKDQTQAQKILHVMSYVQKKGEKKREQEGNNLESHAQIKEEQQN